MKNKTNYVMSGKYDGMNIVASNNSKFARISGGIFLTKKFIQEIKVVDAFTNTESKALTGYMLYGTGGSALQKVSNEKILEIHWKDGDTSLIKVNKDIDERLMIGMREDISEDEYKVINDKDLKDDNFATLMTFILIGVCIVWFIV